MDFKALFHQVIHLLQNLNQKQKIVMVATLVVFIAFIAFLIVYSTSTKNNDDAYGVLFDNISAKDAALIVQQLDKDEIPYKLKNENTILVPKEYVYEERIKVASLGLPANSRVGFELFDKQEFGATDFDQSVKFLRALEGELSKTVESLSPITKANIHIAIPKDSVFVSKQVKPSASVVLELKPNMILTPKQINGIKNLVSSAVSKMPIENVKVISAEGESLGEDDDITRSNELAKTQLKYRRNIEKAYEEKIMKLLAPLLGGEEKVVAKVTIDFDFSQKESTKEMFDPESVVRSEQVNEEKREGFREKEIGGVPGAVSNVGPVEGLDDGTKEKYQKSSTTTNFEISKQVSNIKGEFAIIKRVTAAVVVDGKYEKEEDANGNLVAKFIPLSENDLNKITDIVRKSIGFNTERGDNVAVSNFEFNPNAIKVQKLTDFQKFMKMIEPFLPFIKYGLAALLLFIFYKKVIVPFGQKMLEIKTDEDEIEMPSLAGLEDDQEDAMEKYNDMKKKVEKQLGIAGGTTEGDIKLEILQEKLRNMIEEKPEDAAILLKSLITDEMEFDADSFSKGKK